MHLEPGHAPGFLLRVITDCGRVAMPLDDIARRDCLRKFAQITSRGTRNRRWREKIFSCRQGSAAVLAPAAEGRLTFASSVALLNVMKRKQLDFKQISIALMLCASRCASLDAIA